MLANVIIVGINGKISMYAEELKSYLAKQNSGIDFIEHSKAECSLLSHEDLIMLIAKQKKPCFLLFQAYFQRHWINRIFSFSQNWPS